MGARLREVGHRSVSPESSREDICSAVFDSLLSGVRRIRCAQYRLHTLASACSHRRLPLRRGGLLGPDRPKDGHLKTLRRGGTPPCLANRRRAPSSNFLIGTFEGCYAAFWADAIGTFFGAILGTSSATPLEPSRDRPRGRAEIAPEIRHQLRHHVRRVDGGRLRGRPHGADGALDRPVQLPVDVLSSRPCLGASPHSPPAPPRRPCAPRAPGHARATCPRVCRCM